MTTTRRPLGLSVVGWMWIITGILLAFFIVAGAVVAPVIRSTVQSIYGPIGKVWQLDRYSVWVVVGHLLLAAASILAGAYLLKRRPWARAAVEILTWVTSVYVIGLGYYLTVVWLTVVEEFLDPGTAWLRLLYKAGGGLFCTALTIALLVPLVIMIRYLRGKGVRAAMKKP